MFKLFFGIILFYLCLSNSTIEQHTNNFNQQLTIPPLIPTTPIKNENWNEYIVLSGNNFLNNYYIKPIRVKKKN
jgi:hypothetical protein